MAPRGYPEAYRKGKGPSHGTMRAFLDAVRDSRPGINFATFVGQGNIRAAVLKKEDRDPTAEEMERMKEELRTAVEEGAVGVTSGRRYMPGCLASDDEIVKLMSALSPYGLVYSSHLKNQNDNLIPSFEELYEVGLANDIPVQLTHLKVGGQNNWGQASRVSRMMEEGRRRGIDVTADVYPYTFSGSMARRLSEEEAAEALREVDLNHVDLNFVIDELSKRGVDVQGKGTMDEGDMRHLLAHDYSMVGSDGIVAGPDYDSIGNHPRSYGTFSRVLGHYVRECRLFTLEKAIHKMTQMPAERLKIRNRGILQAGYWADLVIFDEEGITDNSTLQDPADLTSGVRAVYVNGQQIVHRGTALREERPGRVLRYRGDRVS